ncbi:YTH domain-containing protein 1 isoform X2 [Hermetia illucens]|nr:YTH domain-containing protein 1 isoform X2 [Hermetia illucens]
MADLDAVVNLGLDENEADIAEELQGFEDSFDTRSEASADSSSSSATNPSISSVSTDSSVSPKNRRAHLKRERSVNGESGGGGGGGGGGSGGAGENNNRKDNKNTDDEDDDEDEDNDKNNGRKSASASASASPDAKKTHNSSSSANNSKHNSKSYDYMTKLNYLFRDTRFFLIKSNNADNVALSKSKSVWSTLPQNEANLNQAFRESRNVLLIFSVNESGKFAGFARMTGESRRDVPAVSWVLPPSISAKALGGVIEIDWICRKELSFTCTANLFNSWNEGKPVKIGRDGQEIEPKVGAELCRLFPEDEGIELTPILKKSKETARLLRDKGVRVSYKGPPQRGVSMRGRSSLGAVRGKKAFLLNRNKLGGVPPPGVYKRSASPYTGRERTVPPWERYVTSAAAAEAYVADYMRTMQHQLPPMPYIPPAAFSNMIPPNPAVVQPSAAVYENLPPPPRYYEGPPLPEYPPPQQIRPPPPNYEPRPPYERSVDEFLWKTNDRPALTQGTNAGGGSTGGGGNSQGGSNSAGGGGGGGGSYRSNNRDFHRTRDRGRDRSSRSDRERNFRDRSHHRSSYRDRR